MNRTSYSKFKDEIDWFYSSEPNTKIWEKVVNDWRLTKSPDWHIKYKYAINDKYSEFRKAYADGKTIQCYVDGFTGWQDVEPKFNYDILLYRIKEKEFKIGDWIKTKSGAIGSITEITEYEIKAKVGITILSVDLSIEHWTPARDEYCWFYKDNIKIPTLDKFIRFKDNFPINANEEIFEKIEPFLGMLPRGIK